MVQEQAGTVAMEQAAAPTTMAIDLEYVGLAA